MVFGKTTSNVNANLMQNLAHKKIKMIYLIFDILMHKCYIVILLFFWNKLIKGKYYNQWVVRLKVIIITFTYIEKNIL